MKKNIFIKLFSGCAALFYAILSAHAAVPLPTYSGLSSRPLDEVIKNLTSWILGIFGFLAVISFVVSGIMYFFAAGDDTAQEKAKKQMTWSIMGVVIGLAGLVVIYAIDALLGGATDF